MASRGFNHGSTPSSRSVSPIDSTDRPYDPFLSPLDHVEMSNIPRTSHEAKDTYNFPKAPSPSDNPPQNLSSGSYFPASRGVGASLDSPELGRGRLPPQQTWGGSASIYSLGSMSQHQTKDVDTQALVDRRAGELAQWHIHWQTPALIVALFVAGLIAALGHHAFYAKLDGKSATAQLMMVRYGTALAFFVKSMLVGCVVLCYRQRIWHTFRKKAMTISGIDGLFSATEDPTQFFKWEMIRNGKLATFMALMSWFIPIASVLSPAALTSESRLIYSNETTCDFVATINFTHEAVYDFRNVDSYPGASLLFYNTTDTTGKSEGFFDYYDQPSKNARRLTVTSAYLRKPATFPNASIQSCGSGWNCTYGINIQGPGYKCEEPSPNEIGPFNLSMLAPEGKNIYYSNVDLNDYANPQIETDDDGMPAQEPPYPDSLGVFSSEPELWIGYSLNTSKPYDKSSPYFKTWKNVHEPKIFKCVLHYTNYVFEMKYEESLQSTKLLRRDFMDPIINGAPVRPTDTQHYKLTAAYHAMGALLRNFMRGSIFYKFDSKYIVTKSDISETRLMDASTSYPVPNLIDELQNFFEDMIITLLSEPYLVIANTASVPCDKTQRQNVYVYHAQGLWIGYAFAVFIAFVSIFIGAWSIFQNGVSSDIQFSRIMVTTRNPTLDRLSVGACLGGDPFPKELTQTKLRFGVLLEDDVREGPLGRVEHCTFGAAGEVKEIVKNGTYAGLKKWRRDVDEEVGDAWEKGGLLEKWE